MRHPSRTDSGSIAMVVNDYPGKMKIGGRVVRLGNHEMQNLADGRVFERFEVKLYDTSSPHGDRYMDTFKLASMYLELCNISDSGSYCYEHGVEHHFGTTWEIATPPKFSSVEEADAWMEQKELERRVVDNVRAASAYDANNTPAWACPNDPCEVHGCVGPHTDVPGTLPPGSYTLTSWDGGAIKPGDVVTINHGAITWTSS